MDVNSIETNNYYGALTTIFCLSWEENVELPEVKNKLDNFPKK